MSGLVSAFVLSFTVASALGIGVFTAYMVVIGIVHALARQTRPTTAQPIIAPQARVAHAGGD